MNNLKKNNLKIAIWRIALSTLRTTASVPEKYLTEAHHSVFTCCAYLEFLTIFHQCSHEESSHVLVWKESVTARQKKTGLDFLTVDLSTILGVFPLPRFRV